MHVWQIKRVSTLAPIHMYVYAGCFSILSILYLLMHVVVQMRAVEQVHTVSYVWLYVVYAICCACVVVRHTWRTACIVLCSIVGFSYFLIGCVWLCCVCVTFICAMWRIYFFSVYTTNYAMLDYMRLLFIVAMLLVVCGELCMFSAFIYTCCIAYVRIIQWATVLSTGIWYTYIYTGCFFGTTLLLYIGNIFIRNIVSSGQQRIAVTLNIRIFACLYTFVCWEYCEICASFGSNLFVWVLLGVHMLHVVLVLALLMSVLWRNINIARG